MGARLELDAGTGVCRAAGDEPTVARGEGQTRSGAESIWVTLFGPEDWKWRRRRCVSPDALRGSANGRQSENQTEFTTNPNVGVQATKAQRSQSGQAGHCRNAGKLCR